ncbi:acyl-CoA thioesterase [[Mycobacterium] wendilense]|uniref:Thioesterase family protein n=1 Tax=[Mycobacterium] wendilense TaxID=3064284 RepID=A0ABM9M8I0_9MYCO|nr:acyl-CoA thioesterase domain-containing protein [Mycolicibacterium sp. MU0050]CAJ1578967.1 thioesterase family protein [Mycolicibacterium sp. MU0050]
MAGAKKSWIAQLLQFDRDRDTFVSPQAQVFGNEPRLFGGLIAAQALGAAGATVDPVKLPQSLHLYFVRGGVYGVAVEFQVERTRDGRSFDTRRVTAVQNGAVILEMIASFHLPEPGADRHPPPVVTVGLEDAVAKDPSIDFADYFEIRTMPDDTSEFAIPPFWIRTRDEIEDDPLVRSCVLAFMSDFGPVPVARPPELPADGFAASLDHSVWFHRAFDPHQWHRYDVDPVNNSDSRGLVRGSLYNTDRTLIATTSQEALWRS